MARCEDCIHESVCSALIEKGLPWNDGEYPAEAFCMAFQNKADAVPKSEVAKIFEEIEESCVIKWGNTRLFDTDSFNELKKEYEVICE